MTSSSSKRLLNEITTIELNSDRIIDSENYYVIKIELVDRVTNEKVREISKRLGLQNYGDDQKPLVCYVYEKEIYLLFSSIESGEHHLRGSHQTICSFYSSLLAREMNSDVLCSIIEFDSRTKIMAYFQIKINENLKKTIESISNNKLSKKQINTLTSSEIEDWFSENNIDWKKVSENQKYGSFFKLVKKDDSYIFKILSEQINVNNIEKYTKFIFD